MNANYIYFISTLPMLHFGARPPFSFEEFLFRCRDFVDAQTLQILSGITQEEQKIGEPTPIVLMQKKREFEIALKNELVKFRARSRRLEPQRFLRQQSSFDTELAHLAHNLARNPSILESEKELDLARWRYLDELSFGHFFDLEILLVYGLKLLILERWERIRAADKQRLLEEFLAKAEQ